MLKLSHDQPKNGDKRAMISTWKDKGINDGQRPNQQRNQEIDKLLERNLTVKNKFVQINGMNEVYKINKIDAIDEIEIIEICNRIRS